MDFGRIAAQSAKQVIVQKVREAERDRQYDEYKDRIGEIVNGTVKRVEYGNVIVDLGRGEAIIRRDELIPRENYRYGDRVRAYVYDVRREQRGPQIFLSRTHPQFMAKLFTQEVPEIYDGIIDDQVGRPRSGQPRQDRGDLARLLDRSGRRLRRHARQPRPGGGRRTAGRKDRHHPVVAGRRRPSSSTRCSRPKSPRSCSTRRPSASRSWCPTSSCRSPSAAAARTCASPRQLTGWDIDILTEQEESERRQKEFTERSALFMQALDVDEMVAQLLASEGFTAVEEVAYVDARRNRLDRGLRRGDRRAKSRPAPANISTASRPSTTTSARRSASRTSCCEIPGITTAMLVALGKEGIKTVEDFAGYAADDLVGWKERKDGETKVFPGVLANHGVSRAEAEQMVMPARLKAGWITEDDLAPARKRRPRKPPVRERAHRERPEHALGRDERAHMHRHAQERAAG